MYSHLMSRYEQLLSQKLKHMLRNAAGEQSSSAVRPCLPQLVHLLLRERGRPMDEFTQRVHQILADRCRAVTDWDMEPIAPEALGQMVHQTIRALAQLRASISASDPPPPTASDTDAAADEQASLVDQGA